MRDPLFSYPGKDAISFCDILENPRSYSKRKEGFHRNRSVRHYFMEKTLLFIDCNESQFKNCSKRSSKKDFFLKEKRVVADTLCLLMRLKLKTYYSKTLYFFLVCEIQSIGLLQNFQFVLLYQKHYSQWSEIDLDGHIQQSFRRQRICN